MGNRIYRDENCMLYAGNALDVLRQFPDQSVQTCVTSPPYFGLRSYLPDNDTNKNSELGAEPTPDEYVGNLVAVFAEVRRVLRDDGTVWLNLGDTYAGGGRGGNPEGSPHQKQATNQGSTHGKLAVPNGLKPKDLIGIPWRVAFALQADGWWLRSDIIWHKPNPMPESVRDRPTKSHEYVFLLSKSKKYYYDIDAIREPFTYSGEVRVATPKNVNGMGLKPTKEYGHKLNSNGRNKRTVWTVTPKSFKSAHFATFPPDLIRPCILAGAPEGGIVLDPFIGSGTTALVSIELGRRCIGIDLSETYLNDLAIPRLKGGAT